LAVIGGSSPFSAALIDALAQHEPPLLGRELVLQGRSVSTLSLLRDYAERRLRPLGWAVATTTRRETALEDAEVVLHQTRYGGLELRAQGEDLCARHGVQADETLGPAALLSALRTRPAIDEFAAVARRHAPRAWVLNLTNPLSLVTGRIASVGLRCIGLCELPCFTLGEVARVLEVDRAVLDWDYRGLNHRGFLYDVRHGASDRLAELVARLGNERLLGISSATIAELGAIPLKQFRMVIDGDARPVRRAAELSALRQRIVAELERDVGASPPALSARYMEWYPGAVVPMLAALDGEEPVVQVATLPQSDGIARETKIEVCASWARPLTGSPAPPGAQHWIDRFERHEMAVAYAVEHTTADRVERAIELDPTLGRAPIAKLVQEILREARPEVVS
jgi:6-phospho-beta-glucosidase